MAVLETRELTAFYGDFQALFGITFTLDEGETVAIIGANGAGKSTFLKADRRLVAARRRAAVRFDGRDIGALPALEIVKLGIALVPEGRRLFPSLSVEENLLVGAYGRRADGPWDLAGDLPALSRCCASAATPRDGALRRPAADGRDRPQPDVQSARPAVRRDSASGSRPIVIRDIYAALADIKPRGTSVVLVEQDIVQAHVGRRPRLLLPGGPRHADRPAAAS